MFRETVRDFCVNQQFRRDYWVRGGRRLNPIEQGEALRAYRIVMVQPKSDAVLKVTGALGEANLQEQIYGPVLEVQQRSYPSSSPSRSSDDGCVNLFEERLCFAEHQLAKELLRPIGLQG